MSNTDRLTDEELREGCSTLGLPVPSLLSRACCELRAARATIAAQEAELEALRGRVGLAKRLLGDVMSTSGQANRENLIDAKDTLDGVHDDGI